MFGRKRSASQHKQPLSSPASQSAQSAASHAFLKSQTSTTSLSAAAAAAALRSRSPTPTNVENVQTKRMLQRTQSTQSTQNLVAPRRSASGRSASASAPLRRKGSSGSMSSRTFREPSPNRPSTSSGPIMHAPTNVPPLPSLPSQYSRSPHPRRAASLDPQSRASPTSPPRSPIRGAHSDPRATGSPGQLASHHRLGSLTTVPEHERPTSRNSVNFSYPRGARATSPSSLDGWSMNPKAVALREAAITKPTGTQQSIPERSNSTRPRSHAANAGGSATSNVAGAAADTALAAAWQATSPQKSSPRPGPSAARAERVVSESPSTTPRKEPSSSRPPPAPSAHANARETADLEQRSQAEPLPRSESISPAQAATARLSNVSPTIDHVESLPTPQPSPLAGKEQRQTDVPERDSSSPVRSARFSKWLSVAGSDDQIHEPPGRSVSPAKSALKTARGSSLSPERKSAIITSHVQAPSEISDGTSVASDEGSRLGTKKKQVRVSFDEEAEVVGVAASPPTSPEDYVPGSPPSGKAKSRMSWLGVGKKNKASELVTGDDDFDEVLKPRAVLPSFGSVRGNRDSGPPRMSDFSDNESSSSSDEEVSARVLSFSGDHALGNILPKVAESSQEALVADDVKPVEQLPAEETPVPAPEPSTGTHAEAPAAAQANNLAAPSIAVEPATPPLETGKTFDSGKKSPDLQPPNRSSMDQYQVPGGFPPSNSDRSLKSTAKPATPPPAGRVSFEDMDTEAESESIYTDAPEDVDGDGFGSINAIVDARSTPRSATPLGNEHKPRDRDVTPRPAEKAAPDQPRDASAGDFVEQSGDEGRAATPTQESVRRQLDAPFDFTPEPAEPSQQPSQPAFPAQPKARVQNGSVQPKQRMSVAADSYTNASQQDDPRPRDPSSLVAGQGKARPVSLGPAALAAAAQRSAVEPFPSSLRRKTSNGSDSSSSFQRAGRSSRNGGAHSMRRTMRSSASQGPVQSFPDRTESPADYRPMSAGSTTGAQPDRYSFFSTNKKAARTRSGKFPGKAASKSAGDLRFIDSDGEEDVAHPFSSRFADSSDEDVAGGNEKLRPVRGIPRRRGAYDGDSTDLEDSSEEERRQQTTKRASVAAAATLRAQPAQAPPVQAKSTPNMSGMAAVARQRGMTQRELEEFVMQPPGGRKQGFLSRIGLKKAKTPGNPIRKAERESTPYEREPPRDEANPYSSVVTSVSAGGSEPPLSRPKQVRRLSKRHIANSDTSSGRSVKPLRPRRPSRMSRTARKHLHCRSTSEDPTARSSCRECGAQRQRHDQWRGDAAKDPESPQAARPRPHLNRNTSLHTDAASIFSGNMDEPGMARNVVIAGSGRKKRFPGLRKAFGMRA
ncbi:hypothetical protein N7470_003158 [Penicillium chermesinum]|nr:hypothetical protein N7470_003158 [Penicillium chermesinum]